MGDEILAPGHYCFTKLEPWHVIDAWQLNFYCGNAVKYICRHPYKGDPVKDIRKAIRCLEKQLEILQTTPLPPPQINYIEEDIIFDHNDRLD